MPAREPQFLAEASLLLSRSLEPDEALGALARAAVPKIADECHAHLRQGDGAVRVVHEAADPSAGDATLVSAVERVLGGAAAELYGDTHRSTMVVPLVGRGGAVIGTLTFTVTTSGRRYGPESLAVAEDLGRRAGLAVENARLFAAEREARRVAERAANGLERLYQLTLALSSVVHAREVAATFVEAGCSALRADAGFAWLIDESGHALEMVADHGFPASALDRFRRVPLDGRLPVCDALRSGEPVWIATAEEMQARYPETAGSTGPFRSWAVLPFVLGDRGIGGVRFSFREAQELGADERALLDAMARQASLALERCRLFDAERRATEQARLAERRKDEFLAMLGHELRNPLAPLVTAVDLIRLRDPDAFVREREVIERSVGHLTRLIDDLLDVSRITRGMVELTRGPLDVSTVVANAVEMASPLVERRRHHLHVDVPPDALWVDADPIRLAQVVQNLIANSAKYTPAGGNVWVSAAREDHDVVIRVRDDGAGIEPELLPNVFDLFVQGARPIDRPEGGLGLGLTLVKRLVELHGGRVAIDSAGRGQGTEVTVWLPATARVEALAAASAMPAHFSGSRRILVVDDNIDAAETLAEILRNLGYDVATAADGASALELAAVFQPQIGVLDIGLPVMDGYELAQKLRERRPNADLTLIAVTGYGQDDDVARSRAAGFDLHLVKPVDLRVLEAALAGRSRT